MAHGGHGGKGVGGLVPPTGPISALLLLISFGGFIWLIVKHPRTALSCLAVSTVLGFTVQDGVQNSNPLLVFALIWFACEIGEGFTRTKRDRDSGATTPTKEN